MKKLLILLFMLPLIGLAQLPGKYISFSLFIDQIIIGVHPDATMEEDPILDRHHMQFWSKSYSAYYDGTPESYEEPEYDRRLSRSYFPDITELQRDTLEYISSVYGKKTQCVSCWGYPQNYVYPKFWRFNLEGADAYYRASPDDEWVHLNPIMHLLEQEENWDYFGNVYNHYAPDYDDDGYLLCFQIKLKVHPKKIKPRPPVNVINTREGFKFSTPDDDYTVDVYNIQGQLVYSGQFNGKEYMLYSEGLERGWYIYNLNSKVGRWSGKVWKF